MSKIYFNSNLFFIKPRKPTYSQYSSETNATDRFETLRQRPNTPTLLTRSYGSTNLSEFKVPSSVRYGNDFSRFADERSSTFHGSNPTFADRSATPKLNESRRNITETALKGSSHDIQAKAKAKQDTGSYYTDKYYSKDFLSSSKPLSEMIKK